VFAFVTVKLVPDRRLRVQYVSPNRNDENAVSHCPADNSQLPGQPTDANSKHQTTMPNTHHKLNTGASIPAIG